MSVFDYTLSLQDVERIFQAHNWSYQLADEMLFTIFDDVPMIFMADESRNILLLFALIVPGEGARGAISATAQASANAQTYVLATNYRLALGGFSRDHRDGEIRYECSQFVAGPLTDTQVQVMIAATVGTVERHGPVIINLLLGRLSLNQALAQLESGGQGSPAQAV